MEGGIVRIKIIKEDKIDNFDLPKRIYGNYWITDIDKNGDYRNLVNIESINNKWYIKTNFEIKIKVDNQYFEQCELKEYDFYTLEIENENDIMLYCCPVYDNNFVRYKFNQTNISFGSNSSNSIIYNCKYVLSNCCNFLKKEDGWYLDSSKDAKIFVNNKLSLDKRLCNGDIVFIYGLIIVYMGEFILINNPKNLVSCANNVMTFLGEEKDLVSYDNLTNIDDLQAYDRDDYFYKSPRFKTEIEEVKINIDSPPSKQSEDKTPLFYTIGPMMTMAMTSVISGFSSFTNIRNGKSDFKSELPNLIMSSAMILTMVFWPVLTSNYEKRKLKKEEKKRQSKYSKYIDDKRQLINNTINTQKQILIENSISLNECENIIINKKRNLWERNPEHSDFLSLRIGTGTEKPSIDINYPEEHFTMDEDNLVQYLNELIDETKLMENVPINVSLIEKNITAVVGDDVLTKKFIDSLILQIITFHSYDDVRLVLLTDYSCKSEWSYMKNIPHIWNEEKTMRFYGDNNDDVKQISYYLNEELKYRMDKSLEDRDVNYLRFRPYYIIIVDSLKIVRTNDFIKKLLEQKDNFGFSILIKNDRLSNLPKECSTFINIDKQTSGIFENELVSDKQKEFVANIDENIDLEKCAICLSKIPIEFKNGKMGLPNSVGFLEMYNVGMIEQLNILNRWQKNDPTTSLEAPIGIEENGEVFKLDLHEKASGPHGLIAGMTGSGKSEFIITYILSMAINYHPQEVQFVLIDYKGGGLAGAFENKETGVKLPHLVGTITNLETSEMTRSLSSIQSELKRRQRIFNEARDKLNESTVDIYKYQRFYREGKVNTPISHLFIISDEFAELKSQNSDFMQELISTARIGRSLGVHLILATQKPSGVVDDQIWSNSKFRVCLKVQDRSDSMDMIKCPDAASLKNVGRFYLQVGYNEYFGLGQSAWAGTQYLKTEKIKKKVDTTINFINNIGSIVKSVDDEKSNDISKSYGEELPNLVKFLYDLGVSENIFVEKLWLDVIPQFIKVDDLKKKYKFKSEKFKLNILVGEMDIPKQQKQEPLFLNISSNGNIVVYGSAGSGKELMFSTIVYSTIMEHTPDEVNFYILDFGSESLRMYENAPQVGDVVSSIEEEKVNNLFKMLNDIIEDRKKLFANYSGSYESYCKNSGKTLPAIVVLINGYESFSEMYEDLEQDLFKFTREGNKYGIIFIINVSGINNMRFKLQQNFKQSIALQLNDKSDYISVVGNTQGLYPAKLEGRGLIKLDDLYEFQTASIIDSSQLSLYVRNVCDNLKQSATSFARKISILPDVVNSELFKDKLSNLNSFPIGINVNNFDIVYYDFVSKYTTLILSNDFDNMKPFIFEFVNCFKYINNNQVIFLDSNSIFSKNDISVGNYVNSNFKSVLNKVSNYVDNLSNYISKESIDEVKKYNHLSIIIVGLKNFVNNLDEEDKNNFNKILQESKKLNKISFICYEEVNTISSITYEEWFVNNFVLNNCVWIGNGIKDQYVINISSDQYYLNNNLTNQFGYIIKNSNPIQVKLLGEKKDSDE